MKKIQAIGAPFPIEYSSCSNLKPKTFEWTTDDCDIKVFIDKAIASGIAYNKKPNEKKVAWVCESRAIFHAWMFPEDIWEKNIERLKVYRKNYYQQKKEKQCLQKEKEKN